MTIPLKVRIGAVAWTAYAIFAVPDLHDDRWSGALLLLAALVLMPMAWCLARDPEDAGWAARLWRFDLQLQFPAALLLVPAFLLPPGPWALLCALPWAIMLAVMAVDGGLRIRRHGLAPLGAFCRDIGLVYASIGAVWVLADRAGWQPAGFTSGLVQHLAVLFHFYGFMLPVTAGLAQARRPQCPVGSLATRLIIIGVPLVALGLVVTQSGGPTLWESLAIWVLVLGGWGVAWQHAVLAVRERGVSRLARGLWLIAAMALGVGMSLAGLIALQSSSALLAWLDHPWVQALHGNLNPVVFSLAAVLGWCRAGRGCCCGSVPGQIA